MANKINSPEFAQAWRFVSECLLEFFQQGGAQSLTSSQDFNSATGSTLSPSQDNASTEQAIKPEPVRTLKEIRYAAVPIRLSDNNYMFKNLKDEVQPQASTYKIEMYTDGSCEFELCALDVEARQIFKDNQSERMPTTVGSSKGELTSDCQIITIKKGRGVVDGRSVRILEPLEVEFKKPLPSIS